MKTEEEFIEELKLALDYYGKGLSEDYGSSESSEIPQAVKERSKELLVSNLESLHDFHSKWDFWIFFLELFKIFSSNSSQLLNSIKESSDDPAIFAKNFNSLSKDFEEIHLTFLRELDNALRLCQHVDNINKFLEVLKIIFKFN